MTDSTLPAIPMATEPAATRNMGRRWLARLSHPFRHALRINKWPVEWRARIGRATLDELQALEISARLMNDQRELEKALDRLAVAYKRLIVNSLTNVGVSHSEMNDGKRRYTKVKFEKPCIVTREAIYYEVKTDKLPYHISIVDLLEERNVLTLSASCKRVVNVTWDRYQPEKGCWIIVELRAGSRGIPKRVEYAEMLQDRPSGASRLSIPIGRGIAGNPIFDDLGEMPHLLIGGATGQGKTVWLEQALLTLLLHNSPKQLRLGLVDLKGGPDLGMFKSVPHLLRPVIKTEQEVIPLLEFAWGEIKKRQQMFDEKEVVDIRYWNQRNRRRLPRILIVIDELANLMLEGPELKDRAEVLLAKIAAQGRSAGVHAIVATQRPETRVITGLIKANFTTRLAFACADYASSKVILDTGDAAGIGPLGRLVYLKGSRKIEIQGPFVSPTLVREAVAKIAGGQTAEALEQRKRHNLGPEDFFRHAIQRYEGRFPVRSIYEDLKVNGVTLDELRDLARQYEGKEIEVDNAIYLLKPAATGGFSKSRELIKISENYADEDADEDAEDAVQPWAVEALQSIMDKAENTVGPVHGAGSERDTYLGSENEEPQEEETTTNNLDDFQSIPIN